MSASSRLGVRLRGDPGWAGGFDHPHTSKSWTLSARGSPSESRVEVRQAIRGSSLDELSEIAIEAQNLELWKIIASMRRRVLLSSGSDEGTTRFRKKETLSCPSLSSATSYGPWRKAWVVMTEELKGFHLLWHFISRKVRIEYGHLPDAQMLASGSALLSRLLGPEEDMSTSQLQLLDDLERVVGQLQGIRRGDLQTSRHKYRGKC